MKQKSLQQIQKEIGDWSWSQFNNNTSLVTGYPLGSQNALTGLVEEVGELNHVTICYHQGRRGYDPRTPEGQLKYKADRDDALADILIFLCDYASRENTDLQTLLNQTWGKVVSKRTLENWESHNHNTDTATDITQSGSYPFVCYKCKKPVHRTSATEPKCCASCYKPAE